ncbi:oligosaccharyltransferase complex subunit gamma [Entomortierella parvispora]|uniref:Oligosaccharyltransferase complex subunit gamma n=1 Tax=Entomortierella parvispora TaxID=205924 RepID=A0A9P3H5T8_9FUNG|nr:oligosaccharyltransferase complex subunit gamma [Entomortierella parvispora]
MMGIFSRKTIFLTLALAMVALFSTVSTGQAQPMTPEALLGKKVARLQAKATKGKGLIELDTVAFEEVLAMPRNYSMVVLFTAISPEFNCIPCLNFDPEYRLVASGWSKQTDKTRLFFGSLDFKVGQTVFQKFGMNSAPSALYFPPSGAPSSQPSLDRYDFQKSGFQAEEFAKWLNSRAETDIKVKRPFDFIGAAINILGVAGALFSAVMMYQKAGKIFGSRYLWSALSLFTIFVMISGHMWNQIRRPPYTIPGRGGQPGFIAQGFQNQLGLETQIVAVMYALLCGSVIALLGIVPRIEDPSKQRIAVWVSMGLFSLMFSVLIQFFKVKNPGYPFQLLFR